jgi:CubicO group peptidase (beta-lactamase class C family)
MLAVLGGDQSFAEALMVNDAQFSRDKLQLLHEAMAGYVAAGERPGMVTLLSKNGETYVDAIGTEESGGGTAMRRDTIFCIASITKPIVGAATMRLIEEDKVAIDEPIERLIPELANRRVLKRLDGPLHDTIPAKRSILVGDLLTMRMGMGAIMTPGEYPIQTALMEAGVFMPFKMPRDRNADEWIAKLARFPLMDQPGDVWRYDTSITLLGALLERAAGKPLGEILRQHIFEPLGMRDTGFMVPPKSLTGCRPAIRGISGPAHWRFGIHPARAAFLPRRPASRALMAAWSPQPATISPSRK